VGTHGQAHSQGQGARPGARLRHRARVQGQGAPFQSEAAPWLPQGTRARIPTAPQKRRFSAMMSNRMKYSSSVRGNDFCMNTGEGGNRGAGHWRWLGRTCLDFACISASELVHSCFGTLRCLHAHLFCNQLCSPGTPCVPGSGHRCFLYIQSTFIARSSWFSCPFLAANG